ncbi:flippase [Flavobacterium enshiense]|uniref:flippase n=1 Tax=Flavobacterium enshiense TaxID=1341165 RepID=UPI00345CC9D0
MSSFLRDLVRIGFSKVKIILFGFGISVLTARLLSPEENGVITTLLNYPSLFLIFGSLGIRQAATYFVGKEIYSLEKVKDAVFQVWIFTSITSIIGCYFLFYFFSKSVDDLALIIITLCSIPFSLHNVYCAGIFLGQGKINDFNKVNWIPNMITFFAIVLLVVAFKFQMTGVIIAYLLGHISVFIGLFLKKGHLTLSTFKVETKIIREMLSLGLVYALALLVINLNYRVDLFLLENLSTSYELGIYSKGATVVQYLWQIPMLLGVLVYGRSAISKNGLEFSKKVTQLMRLSILIVGGLALVLFVFSKYFILLMFGEKFLDSVAVMQILMPGIVILTIFKVMNVDLDGKGKPWVAIKAMLFPLILNVVCNLYLIPLYGAVGAAMASLISYTVGSVIFIWMYSREIGISVREILTYRMSDFEPVFALLKKIKR